MRTKLCILLLFVLFSTFINAQETISISGRVTDFNGTPIEGCNVELKYSDFSNAYEGISDKDGYYILNNVKKGKYMGLIAIRKEDYLGNSQAADPGKRLEFWAWNIIADKDLIINPRYHLLELYGMNVYKVEGAYPGLFIYIRPMSGGKILSYIEDIMQGKTEPEGIPDTTVKPEHFRAKVYIDDKEVQINSVQPIQEYVGKDYSSMGGFLIQTELPQKKTDEPYLVIKIVAENLEYNEKGENIYFYEIKDYERNPK